MHCVHCGTAIGVDARFCPRCGKEQPRGAIGDMTQTSPTVQRDPTSPSMAQAAAASVIPDAGEVRPGKTPVIAIAGGLLAVALGGGAIWGWDKYQDAQESAKRAAEMEQKAALLQQQNQQAQQVAQTANMQAAKAAEEAEKLAITVAQAALDKAIREEEDQAKARLASATR